MRVIKKTYEELYNESLPLRLYVEDLNPDHVVYIANGGLFMRSCIDPLEKYPLHQVTIQHRISKDYYSFIRYLPECVTNVLRNIVRRLSSKKRIWKIDESIRSLYGLVVLVDDCVDTGTTVEIAKNFINADVRIVSFNDITGKYSDAFVYSNVIIKFPWCFDYVS